ncbi:MAG: DUF2231 domain-containing protein [Sporocytophaga sp.]|uniref:DUF2231 domain-containing protein n=1 Tax=Sporocytophaga sp. TaxID=2231183 RepID=UPI001B0AA526|nr:DUF2231 domain-containing protein [Sporocytophaga sp.]MBO9702045.1 DUF2231 domain-containing protein [Sporocytophaga sp.]
MGLFNELSKGKLLGHPIHVMLVHFPLALFPVSLVLDIIYLQSGGLLFSTMSFYCLCIGLAGGFAAAVFGLWDLLNIGKDPDVLRTAFIHGGINSLILFSYTIIATLRYKQPDYASASPDIQVITNALLNVLLVTAAYFGGELVFRYKVGIKK